MTTMAPIQAARIPCSLQTKQTPKTLLGKESRMATIAEDTTKGIKKKSPRDFLNTVVGRPWW